MAQRESASLARKRLRVRFPLSPPVLVPTRPSAELRHLFQAQGKVFGKHA